MGYGPPHINLSGSETGSIVGARTVIKRVVAS
jgi:hypothetical protein